DRRNLEQVIWELKKQVGDDSADYKQGPQETVKALLARPAVSPHIAYRASFPVAGLLDKGEKYLLHRWLLKQDERYHLVYAYPVWLVVKAADGDAGGWRVVHDNLCPRCGHAVLPDHLSGDGDDRSHQRCRKLWEKTGWAPPSGM